MDLSQPTTPLPFLIVSDHNHPINLISPNPEFLYSLHDACFGIFDGVALTEEHNFT